MKPWREQREDLAQRWAIEVRGLAAAHGFTLQQAFEEYCTAAPHHLPDLIRIADILRVRVPDVDPVRAFSDHPTGRQLDAIFTKYLGPLVQRLSEETI